MLSFFISKRTNSSRVLTSFGSFFPPARPYKKFPAQMEALHYPIAKRVLMNNDILFDRRILKQCSNSDGVRNVMQTEPRQLVEQLEATASLPAGPEERFNGYGVMGPVRIRSRISNASFPRFVCRARLN